MNELIKINYETEQPTVSARDLYDLLSSEGGLSGTERFSKWIERYIGYGFRESVDYSTPHKKVRVKIEGKREVSREVEDYDLSVDMAKQICMLQRTEKGMELRQYFIDLEKAWNTPEQIMARALKMADKTIAKLQSDNHRLTEQVNVKDQIIGELKPRADYTDKILQNKGLVTITQIAKDYGMTGQEMNQKLHELGIQYKQSGQWLLYKDYQKLGYTHSETVDITRADGRADIKMNTKWTQKGRLFIYNKLKAERILPIIERRE